MDVHQPVGIGSDFLGYRIEELIGRGGMGVVYRAYDLRLKRPVALKLVAPSLARDERFRERFARESELVMSLEHPNVIPIYDAGDAGDRIYLAMRLVDGTDLGSLLRAEGALDPAHTIAICTQIAAALDAAHDRGLVHRDVKPSNVLLDGSGHVYLADFGLTRRLDDDGPDLGEDGSVGTPAYVAPEQIEGLLVDGRADVYSLGCVLFECLTGEPVFRRGTRLAAAWAHLEEEPPRASRTRRGLPEAVDRVILRALAKQPEDRFPTSGALVAAAESALGMRRSPRVRSVAVAVSAAALAIAASLAFVILGRGSRSPAVAPHVRGNTLVRIDPGTDSLQRVIDVGAQPMAVASSGGTVWVYSRKAGVVSEVDARTNRVLHATKVSVSPVALPTAIGPVLAADSNGAWLVGLDRRGRGVLTFVRPGGGGRNAVVGGRPLAVAVGDHAVWVLDDVASADRLLRLDPATGTVRVQRRLPVSARLQTMTFGFGHVWLVGSTTAKIYRIDPRTNSEIDVDLGQRAGRPVAITARFGSVMFSNIWVGVIPNDGVGQTALVDPNTMIVDQPLTGGVDSGIGTDTAGAFGSVWSFDAGRGEVDAWKPPSQPHVIQVTDPPIYDGSCMTSLAAGGGAVWVTLASSNDNTCQFP